MILNKSKTPMSMTAHGFESQGHDAAAARDGEQGMMASMAASWVLANPANHCFVSASVLALVWASLHRFHFSMV